MVWKFGVSCECLGERQGLPRRVAKEGGGEPEVPPTCTYKENGLAAKAPYLHLGLAPVPGGGKEFGRVMMSSTQPTHQNCHFLQGNCSLLSKRCYSRGTQDPTLRLYGSKERVPRLLIFDSENFGSKRCKLNRKQEV